MRRSSERGGRTVAIILLTLLAATCLAGASEDSVYRVPDQALVDIIDTPKTPHLSISPTREWGVLVSRPGYPSIAELAERELRLAGRRIKPGSYSPSRVWPNNELEFVRIEDLEQRPVTGLPENPRISNVRWSPDGHRISFTNTTPDGVELWVAEVEDGVARRLTDPVVSLTAGIAPGWLFDSNTLICVLVPPGNGPPPEAPSVPEGPVVQESIGVERAGSNLSRTCSVARTTRSSSTGISLRSLPRSRRTKAESDTSASRQCCGARHRRPTGEYVIVHTLHRPYSYTVPAYRFPASDRGLGPGGQGRAHGGRPSHFARRSRSRAAAPTRGRAASSWRADAPATLYWAEALDGGDAGAEAEYRDRLYILAAPFDGEPDELITLELRFYGGHVGSRRPGDRRGLVVEGPQDALVEGRSPARPTSSPSS